MALAAGKWLAAAAVNLAAVAACVAVFWLILGYGLLGGELAFDVTRALGVLVLLLPLVLLAPALQLLVGLSCHSFKEAQTYLSLLLFVPMLPGFLFAFGTVRERAWMGAVPLVGQQLQLSRLLQGESVGSFALEPALLWIVTVFAALLCVALAAGVLDRERMVAGG